MDRITIPVSRRERGAFNACRYEAFVIDTLTVSEPSKSDVRRGYSPKDAVLYIHLGVPSFDSPKGSDAMRGAWLDIKQLMNLSTAIDTLIEEWFAKQNEGR